MTTTMTTKRRKMMTAGTAIATTGVSASVALVTAVSCVGGAVTISQSRPKYLLRVHEK